MAQAGQKIRLPGQARVDPAEYREFLMLGHGGVFDLDVDACGPCLLSRVQLQLRQVPACLVLVAVWFSGVGQRCQGVGVSPAADFSAAGRMAQLIAACRVVDAPWRSYAADYRDFFNYDMNMWGWKEYAKRIQLHRVESAMQRKIQTFSTSQVGQLRAPAERRKRTHPSRAQLPRL